MNSDEEMQKFVMKYPEINEFFDDSRDQSMPVFIKLMATILFIKQKMGYHVDKTEVFYCHISKLDPTLFSSVEKEDLPILLELFVSVTCDYVCGADLIEIDDVQAKESKRKICAKIRGSKENLRFSLDLSL
jgi:hypothetical protein